MTATKIQPVAEICSASHENAEFGERAIKPLRDISGFEYGTPLYAGAAPAAVAPKGVVAWMTPEGDRVVTAETMDGARKDGGASLSSLRPYTVALVRAAAPALEAPAAPATPVLHDIDAGIEVMAWLRENRAPHSIYCRMSACLFGDPDKRAALAAAPQAPRLGEDALHLLRRLLSNQHTLTGPEFRAELEKIVAEESARHAAAPQAPAAPSGEVISANCEFATVRWLNQTSVKGGGDPRNSYSWPITGEKVFLASPAAPAVDAMSQAARDVLAERRRQVEAEGYDTEHDDAHVMGEIGALAALYLMPDGARDWDATSTTYGATLGQALLPEDWTMPTMGEDRRRDVVKGIACGLAELERLDRAAQAKEGGEA